MSGWDRRRWVLLVLAGSVCLLPGYAGYVASGENVKPITAGQSGQADPVNVVFPPHRSVLVAENVDLIGKAPQAALEVDGKPHPWEPFQPPLRVSRLKLPPGMHELRVGDRRLEVFLAENGQKHNGPKDWEVWRSHPMKSTGKKRCSACHETTRNNGLVSVGEVKSYEACFKCHRSVDFEVDHSHILEPLEACQMCHAMHGSVREALLKAPPRQLCQECHDPDH